MFESSPGQRHVTEGDRYLYAQAPPKFKLVIIGTGTIGQEHMRVAAMLGRARVYGIFDTQIHSLDSAEENFKNAFWNRYNSILESRIISYNYFKSIVDANIAQIELEIQLQIGKHQAPSTIIEWNIELDKMLTLFQYREQVVYELVE